MTTGVYIYISTILVVLWLIHLGGTGSEKTLKKSSTPDHTVLWISGPTMTKKYTFCVYFFNSTVISKKHPYSIRQYFNKKQISSFFRPGTPPLAAIWHNKKDFGSDSATPDQKRSWISYLTGTCMNTIDKNRISGRNRMIDSRRLVNWLSETGTSTRSLNPLYNLS